MGSQDEADETFNVGRAVVGRETEKALLVNFTAESLIGAKSMWIPKSVVHDDSEAFDATEHAEGDLVVKRWFAIKQGWESE